MKIRDFDNTMERLEDAHNAIVYAEMAIGHGGNEKTMEHKHKNLNDAEQALENLLDEDV